MGKFRRFLAGLLPFAHCMYIDVPEYFADSLFEKHGVMVKREYSLRRPGDEFLIVLCRIRRRDREKYLQAIGELDRKMILCGHPGYEAYCRQICEKLSAQAKEDEAWWTFD